MEKHIKQNLLKLQGFYLFSFFAVGSLTPLLSVYLSEVVKFNGFQIGIIMSISPIIMMFLQPLWGIACDATGKPVKILTITTVLAGILGLGYLWVHEYYSLIMISIILAIFQSAIIPVSDSISVQYTDKTKANYGKIRMYGSLGFGVAVFMMGRLSETELGLEVIFYAFFIGLMIAGALAFQFPEESYANERPNLISGVKELFMVKPFIIFLIITFMIFGPNLANNVYYGLFIEESGGTYTGIGIAFLLAVLSEIPFMRVAGNWIFKVGLLPIILISGIASCIRFLFYFMDPGLGLIYATSVIQGFALGLFIPAGLQYIQQIIPVHITVTAVTVHAAIANGLGNWFSTFTAGILMEESSIYSVYLFFGVMSIIGIVLTIYLMMNERKSKLKALQML